MATYTPNYNLYKPDSTDNYGDFRTEFNNNMDTIDLNMGGGGGGHTIVDESGTSLPSETKLQFTDGLQAVDDNVNGKTVVSLAYFSIVNGAINVTFDDGN